MLIPSPKYYNLFFYMAINLSTTHYRPPSRKYISSTLITDSGIFLTQKAEWLPLAINPHQICCTSLNTDTYQFTTIVFFYMAINLSTTIGLQAGSTFLPHSLATLVYFREKRGIHHVFTYQYFIWVMGDFWMNNH